MSDVSCPTTPNLTVFCRNCGQLSPAGSKKCVNCGSENVQEAKPTKEDSAMFASEDDLTPFTMKGVRSSPQQPKETGPNGEPMHGKPIPPEKKVEIVP